jgi:hypothetical protein
VPTQDQNGAAASGKINARQISRVGKALGNQL